MTLYPLIRVYTDGGSRNNPGPAAIGVVVCDENDNVVKAFGEYIGRTTNNQAEYRALIRGLELAANYTQQKVICTTDSELVVRQMKGRYRTKDAEMKRLYDLVKLRERAFEEVEYVNLPRLTGHLAEADKLVNDARDAALTPADDARIPAKSVKYAEDDETPVVYGKDIVDPSSIGEAFVKYCVKQGWLIKEETGGVTRYYMTRAGRKMLWKIGIVV